MQGHCEPWKRKRKLKEEGKLVHPEDDEESELLRMSIKDAKKSDEILMKGIEARNRRILELDEKLEEVCLEKNELLKQMELIGCRIVELETLMERQGHPASDESLRKELETKEHRIVDLEGEIATLENFLKEHADAENVREMELIIERKSRRIDELEETVAEFEDFLKQNPDVKDLHDLREQVTIGARRIQELERWIQKNASVKDARFDQSRVLGLEEMVTNLELYVKEHNVDVLKQKLQDRECRIEQLQGRVNSLEKEALRTEENRRTESFEDKKVEEQHFEKERKMKEMEHEVSEKDDKIQDCEHRISEYKDEIDTLRKVMLDLEKEIKEYEAEDIGVLKEEIRVRDERILQLEDELDSLERAFNDRIDLEQIEELVNVVKDKEDKELEYLRDLERKNNRIEELNEALRESVMIAGESEQKFKDEEKLKLTALQRVSKLEQRIASIQSASALKCSTCKPLLSKLTKAEKKLQILVEERTSHLADLYQMKREALKAAVSEKDAHLALLELSGVKTAAQIEQVEKLNAERNQLLERLKKEDEKCIELSIDKVPSDPDDSLELLTEMLDLSDEEYETDETITNSPTNDADLSRLFASNGNRHNSHAPRVASLVDKASQGEQLENRDTSKDSR